MIEEALLPCDGMALRQDPLEGHDCSAQANRMIPSSDKMNVVRHDCQAEQLQFSGLFVDTKGLADRLKYLRMGEGVEPTLFAANCYKERVCPVDPGW